MFRKCRSITIPLGRGLEAIVGWECGRPFVAFDRDDDGCPERIATYGGCRIVNGPGCEYECDGCLSINTWLLASDDWTDEEVDAFLDKTVHNKRCASLN